MVNISQKLEDLKKDLVTIREVSGSFYYPPVDKSVDEHKRAHYILPQTVRLKLLRLKKQQLEDVKTFAKHRDEFSTDDAINAASSLEDNEINYFNAKELESVLDRVNYETFYDVESSEDLVEGATTLLVTLDKIFKYEIQKLKLSKIGANYVGIIQKISKVHDKIKANNLAEAITLMTRYYNEEKKHKVVGYLYFELLYAKVSKGNLKTLAKARDVANNVCFLAEKAMKKWLDTTDIYIFVENLHMIKSVHCYYLKTL